MLLFSLLRQDAAQPGPVRRGECAQERPAGARAGCARFVECTGMYIRRTPERIRAPAGQDARRARRPGCAFFGYFLCTSKESSPLGAAERKLCT